MADHSASPFDPAAIAQCALHHYHNHLHENRGKPKDDEWTVYAAIVACKAGLTFPGNKYWVVSCATGSKCTAVGPEGWTVRDSHAEVLCKRGLVRDLWKEVLELRNSTSQTTIYPHSLLERAPTTSTTTDNFRLRSNLSLHLYISDSPCGDASIYHVDSDDTLEQVNFTGAKVIVSPSAIPNGSMPETLLPILLHTCDDENKNGTAKVTRSLAREDVQALGVLRTKSGRSNLPSHLRSTSMSCSDKLLRWCVLGLQGTTIPIQQPIRLSSIVVSRDTRATKSNRKDDDDDEQRQALERAVCGRIHHVVEDLQARTNLTAEERHLVQALSEYKLAVVIVDERFVRGKSQFKVNVESTEQITRRESVCSSKKRSLVDEPESGLASNKKRKKEPSPCGFSLSWRRSDPNTTEVSIGARGIRQGKKPKSHDDYQQLASCLSRGAIMTLVGASGSYREWKCQSNPFMRQWRQLVFTTSPFQGWWEGTRDFVM